MVSSDHDFIGENQEHLPVQRRMRIPMRGILVASALTVASLGVLGYSAASTTNMAWPWQYSAGSQPLESSIPVSTPGVSDTQSPTEVVSAQPTNITDSPLFYAALACRADSKSNETTNTQRDTGDPFADSLAGIVDSYNNRVNEREQMVLAIQYSREAALRDPSYSQLAQSFEIIWTSYLEVWDNKESMTWTADQTWAARSFVRTQCPVIDAQYSAMAPR